MKLDDGMDIELVARDLYDAQHAVFLWVANSYAVDLRTIYPLWDALKASERSAMIGCAARLIHDARVLASARIESAMQMEQDIVDAALAEDHKDFFGTDT